MLSWRYSLCWWKEDYCSKLSTQTVHFISLYSLWIASICYVYMYRNILKSFTTNIMFKRFLSYGLFPSWTNSLCLLKLFSLSNPQEKIQNCKGYCFHEHILCADWKKMFFQQIYFFSFKSHSGHSENMYDFLCHVFPINLLVWCQNHTLDILKIWFISPMN